MAPSLQSLCRDPNELLGAWSPREVSVLLNFQSYSLTGLCQQTGWRWAALKSQFLYTPERRRERGEHTVCLLFGDKVWGNPGWPGTISNFWSSCFHFPEVLGLWGYTNTLGLYSAEDWIQGFMHVGQLSTKLVSWLLFLIVFTKYFSLNRQRIEFLIRLYFQDKTLAYLVNHIKLPGRHGASIFKLVI